MGDPRNPTIPLSLTAFDYMGTVGETAKNFRFPYSYGRRRDTTSRAPPMLRRGWPVCDLKAVRVRPVGALANCWLWIYVGRNPATRIPAFPMILSSRPAVPALAVRSSFMSDYKISIPALSSDTNIQGVDWARSLRGTLPHSLQTPLSSRASIDILPTRTNLSVRRP